MVYSCTALYLVLRTTKNITLHSVIHASIHTLVILRYTVAIDQTDKSKAAVESCHQAL